MPKFRKEPGVRIQKTEEEQTTNNRITKTRK